MSDGSPIEWTEATWNPTTGCDRVSPGCDNCYALTLAKRLKGMGSRKYQRDGDPRTSGPGFGLSVHSDVLGQPMRWREPRRIFVNSMSDLFHDQVPDRFVADVFAVMSIASQHTYQVLTKRHARMRSLLSSTRFWHLVSRARSVRGFPSLPWTGELEPLPHVWLGVSVEDQKWADIRIPALLETPAAVRWISAEPLLGPVDLAKWLTYGCPQCERHGAWTDGRSARAGDEVDEYWCQTCGAEAPLTACIPPGLSWVVCGGESGPGARPMNPSWARGLRDQCASAAVPFFFKQWGAWEPLAPVDAHPGDSIVADDGAVYRIPADRFDGFPLELRRRSYAMRRVSKKSAGRLLDGRTWDEFPEPSRQVSGV